MGAHTKKRHFCVKCGPCPLSSGIPAAWVPAHKSPTATDVWRSVFWGFVLSILNIVGVLFHRGLAIACFCSVAVPLLAQWLCHVAVALICLVLIALIGAQSHPCIPLHYVLTFAFPRCPFGNFVAMPAVDR